MNSQYGGGFNPMSNLSNSAQSSSASSQLSADFLTMITSNTRSQTTSQRFQDDDEDSGPLVSETYRILTRCWRYERGSSLLLPYPLDFFIIIKNYINRIEGLLSDKRITNEIQASLHELELERLRYIYNDVHRIRLRKIELHPIYYAYDKSGKEKLSAAELEFAKGYAQLVMGTMKEGFGDLPGQLGREAVVFETPATDHVALLHYLPKDPEEKNFSIPNQELRLPPNTVIIVPYQECQVLIKNGEFDVL